MGIMNVATQNVLSYSKANNKSNDKGSIGNRIDCMNEQVKEFQKYRIKSNLTMVGGVATTAAATAVVAKSTKAQTAIKDLGKKIINNEQVKAFVEEAKPHVKKFTGFFKNLPGPAKVVMGACAGLTGLALGIQNAHANRKYGQIDQKYTDRAKLQKNILD